MQKKYFTVPKVVNFVTSIGASIVIIGALMKITHRENADIFLTIGLVTESIIFFMYAFIPPKEEVNLQSLLEGLPKQTKIEGKGGDIPTELNDNLTALNKNMSEFNNGMKKFRDALKA